MAKIFSAGMDGNSTLLMELPNHYVIGGHLYKKQGLVPVPGGVFTLSGPNYGSPRTNFGYGHAAGRGLYEDAFTELGTFVNGPTGYAYDPSIYATNTYTRKMQPRPWVMDEQYPNYAYMLVTGTFNGRAVLTASPDQNTNAPALNSFAKPEELRPMYLIKLDLRTNTVVWESSNNTAFFPDFIICDQDVDYLYFAGRVRYSLVTDKLNPSLGRIDKRTGAVTRITGLGWGIDIDATTDFPATYSVDINSSSLQTRGGMLLDTQEGVSWYGGWTRTSNAGFAANPTYQRVHLGIGARASRNWELIDSMSAYSVVIASGATANMRTALQNLIGSALVERETNYVSYLFGPIGPTAQSTTDATIQFYRCRVNNSIAGAPATTTIFSFYEVESTNLFTLPLPTIFQVIADILGMPIGRGKIHAFVRDNGDSTSTTFLFTEFSLSRTSMANDDGSCEQYLVRLDAEDDVASNTANKATLVQTFYDAHYGLVWIDDLTFMTVGQYKFRVYRVDLETEQIIQLNEYRVTDVGYEIAYAAVDTSKNIWWVERTMPDKKIHNVHFETTYVVSSVDINFQLLDVDYTGTDINTNVEVATKNTLNEFFVSSVKLELEGPAKFASNDSNTETVTTLDDGPLVVPIVITGPGYVNCVGKVVE